jgi:hypothetical protein
MRVCTGAQRTNSCCLGALSERRTNPEQVKTSNTIPECPAKPHSTHWKCCASGVVTAPWLW